MWLSESSAFKGKSHPFNNKSAPSDTRMWNLKSECAERFVKAIKSGEYSIGGCSTANSTTRRNAPTPVKERLLEERRALRGKDSATSRFEIIEKTQMKLEVGHSPDFRRSVDDRTPVQEKDRMHKTRFW